MAFFTLKKNQRFMQKNHIELEKIFKMQQNLIWSLSGENCEKKNVPH